MDNLPLKFSVSYRLGEYLHIFRAITSNTPELASLSPPKKSIYMAIITVVATFIYFKKLWMVGKCHFTIDLNGIKRRSKGDREIQYSWNEVTEIQVFKVGYMLRVGDSGMPIPLRVLSESQQETFATVLASCGTLAKSLTQPGSNFDSAN